jgi:radical SAM protein (TIGR01212 family)
LNVCAHVILGLPGESRSMVLETARHLASLPLKGVKIHALYIVKGTPLSAMYERGQFHCLSRENYVEWVVDFLEMIPSDVVVQRLTGDPLHVDLQAPEWVKEKATNLKLIHQRLEERRTRQGKKYQSLRTSEP